MSDLAKAAAVGSVSGLVSGLVGMAVAFVAISVGQGVSRRRKAQTTTAPPTSSKLSVVHGGAS